MNYLVTGGAGFIGSHLAAQLLRDGHREVIVDDFNVFDTERLDAVVPLAARAGDVRRRFQGAPAARPRTENKN
jgi:nucleoside-diphosphate-sugar epimerase